jgi:poly(A) polymerase
MNIFNKIKNLIFRSVNPSLESNKPTIVLRAEHNISRRSISRHVLKVLYTLKERGFQSYLVGGGVRDLLLGKQPKDFDIATNAYPEKIKKLFKHCYIIGRRFPLVHVCFGKDIVEVATFRAKHCSQNSKEGMILRDNVYGNIEQDALRRDFTINALYYNIVNYSLVDYVGGLKDLYAKQICLIGDPVTRYREDPVRMLRAIRFAAKLDFNIHPDTAKPIINLGKLLLNISSSRLYDEYVKLFFTGHPINSFKILKEYQLIDILFPNLYAEQPNKNIDTFILHGLKDLENKLSQSKELNPAYLIAIFLWHSMLQVAKDYMTNKKMSEYLAYKSAAEQLLLEQNKIISISKKLMIFIKDIWLLQLKLSKISGKPGKRADKLIDSIKFSAAFSFLLLRASSGDKRAQKISRWWYKYLATKGKNNNIQEIANI